MWSPAILTAAVALLSSGCASTGPVVPPASGYARSLIEAADERALHAAPTWRALLHYPSERVLGSERSYVQSDAFFLAADGASDARAELHATLEAFVRDGDVRCRYPARFAWLEGELGIDRERLADAECDAYAQWREDVGPALAASVVFADSFMNNPSSMFGHTLIRFDRVPTATSEERRDLGAYAVNFAAETGEDTGALYAVRGILGGYHGYYSLLPYYAKVRQYSDLESRDLWEYPLDLPPERVDFLLQHLWELRDVPFPYYYFSQNCSYHLLGLLEVAHPDPSLRARFPLYTIPTDSLRAALDEIGLAGEPSYRPSAATRLAHEARSVPPEVWALAGELARGEREPGDPSLGRLGKEHQAAALTLAHDKLSYEASGEDRPSFRGRALALLAARSRVAVRGAPGDAPKPPAARPDQGHGTARLRIGTGNRDGRAFVSLGARPALHDVLDPVAGYVPNAEIAFLDTDVRYYPTEGEIDLHRLTLLEVVSVAPRDDVFTPVSWSLRTGLENDLVEGSGRDDLTDASIYRSRGGAGLSRRLGELAMAYVFLEGTADFAGKLAPEYAIAGGARAGLQLGDRHDRWRAHLHAGVDGYFLGDTRTALRVGLDQRVRFGEHLGLELELTGRRDFGETWLEAGAYLRFYP